MTGDSVPPAPLVIRCEPRDDVLLVYLAGELDMSAKGHLAHATQWHRDGVPRIVIDMTELVFMDSTGLADIVAIQRAEQKRGGGLSVRGAQPQVRRVFEITGLNTLLAD